LRSGFTGTATRAPFCEALETLSPPEISLPRRRIAEERPWGLCVPASEVVQLMHVLRASRSTALADPWLAGAEPVSGVTPAAATVPPPRTSAAAPQTTTTARLKCLIIV
jgi:hypothetical protein